MHITVETQPICPYCNSLMHNPQGKNRQKCCMKAECLEKHRAAQRKHALMQKREYMKNRYKKRPNLNGQDVYYPERVPTFKKARNPYGHKCHNPLCKKVIIWTWRNGELWDAPRYYCNRDYCQRIRAIRADHSPLETYQLPNKG